MKIFGVDAEIITEDQCRRSSESHKQLRMFARDARRNAGFDVDNSYTLCGRCGKLLPLGGYSSLEEMKS